VEWREEAVPNENAVKQSFKCIIRFRMKLFLKCVLNYISSLTDLHFAFIADTNLQDLK